MTDDMVATPEDAMNVIRLGAADRMKVKVTKHGFDGARAICAMLSSAGLTPVLGHVFEMGLAAIAEAQFAACTPGLAMPCEIGSMAPMGSHADIVGNDLRKGAGLSWPYPKASAWAPTWIGSVFEGSRADDVARRNRGGGAVRPVRALWIATALGLPYMGDYAPGSGFLPLWLGVGLLVFRHPCRGERSRSRRRAVRRSLAQGRGSDARSFVCVAVIDTAGIRGRRRCLPAVPAARSGEGILANVARRERAAPSRFSLACFACGCKCRCPRVLGDSRMKRPPRSLRAPRRGCVSPLGRPGGTDMEAFANLAQGFAVLLQLKYLGFCFAGVLVGQIIGALPGIGPSAAIAILLPLTFGGDPTGSIIMFAGIYYGAQYGGTLTSVLVSIPGESSTVMTSLDGYQMARNGRAGVALGMAAIALVHRGNRSRRSD